MSTVAVAPWMSCTSCARAFTGATTSVTVAQNSAATSVASLLLTTEAMIAEKVKPQKGAGAGAGPDYGGDDLD